MPHPSSFGSPKSADSLAAIVNAQISPASTLVNNPLFQPNGLLPPVKLEPTGKSIDSTLAATPAISGTTAAPQVQQQPPHLATTAALQWPYNMVPNMFNNNFYGNVAAGM